MVKKTEEEFERLVGKGVKRVEDLKSFQVFGKSIEQETCSEDGDRESEGEKEKDKKRFLFQSFAHFSQS